MAKHIAEKHATDNRYFHQDFHINCDQGLRYLVQTFGIDALDEYLKLVAQRYFAPLVQNVRAGGLPVLREYFQTLYEKEEASDALSMELEGRSLSVCLTYCPAVRYMREKAYTPSPYYRATTDVLYRHIAEAAGLKFYMEYYEEGTGAARFSFLDTNEGGKQV